MLLPTVRSRCQRLRFGPLTPGDVADVLIRDHGIDAGGSARGGRGRGRQRRPRARRRAPRTRTRRATPRRGCCRARPTSTDPRRRLDGAKALTGGGGDRDELSRRLLALSSLIRDMGLLLSRADDRALANADLKPQLQALLRSFDGDRTLRAFAAVDRALSALDRNASPKIVADWLALTYERSAPASGSQLPAFVSVKFTPAGRTVSFLLPDLHDRRRRRASRWSWTRPTGRRVGTVTRDRRRRSPRAVSPRPIRRRSSSGARAATTSSSG